MRNCETTDVRYKREKEDSEEVCFVISVAVFAKITKLLIDIFGTCYIPFIKQFFLPLLHH